jgi:hypothetical protein
MKTFSLNRLIVVLVAGGFAFLLVETRLEHLDVINHHPLAVLPLAFSFIGLVLAAITAWRWKEPAIRALQVFLMLVALVGVTGLVLHNSDRFEGEQHEMGALPPEQLKDAGPPKEGTNGNQGQPPRPRKKHFPPMLAPTAFIGIAAVGLLGTSRRWQAEVR